ncbi:hypothetical protein PInf_004396 [Phytophthora infestans]|nr:hypothetical protein PInf_004396 [Phytophthora infestans]
MDFTRNEVRYYTRNEQVVIPFRADDDESGAKVAAMRLMCRTRLRRSAVTPVEVSVAASDGEEGLFIPTQSCGTVMMATTLTRVKNGKALVPVVNTHGGRVRLPDKRELGTWIPLEKSMQVLEMGGAGNHVSRSQILGAMMTIFISWRTTYSVS